MKSLKFIFFIFLLSLSFSALCSNEIFWYRNSSSERVLADGTVFIDFIFVGISTYAWYIYIRGFDAKKKYNDFLFLIPLSVSLLMLYWREVVMYLMKLF